MPVNNDQPVKPSDHKAAPNSEDTQPSIYAGKTVLAKDNEGRNGPIGG
jgi:hypothetical protein